MEMVDESASPDDPIPTEINDMAESAACPICHKPVPLEAMNNHLDICLLPGGKELHSEQQTGPARDSQDMIVSSSLATSPSQSFSAPVFTSSSQLLSAQSSMLTRKRSSPSTSPSSSSTSKQSFLSFGQTAPPQLSTSTSTTIKPPPAKSRKLSRSSVVTKQSTDHSDHGETANAVPSRSGKEKRTGSDPASAPLAELMRPATIGDYVGQESVIGKNAILRTILESGNVPSLIFWGPPGCGKTTLARIIARVAHQKLNTKFVQLSATTAGVKDVKEVVQAARNDKIMFKRNTILFIDEIHRFNKLQQDTFLPHVEDGTITLLGATTENPSFQLNSALLSRCRVIVLEKLESEDIEQLLRRAVEKLGAVVKGEEREQVDCQSETVLVEAKALTTLSQLCDGDARSALNGLELAVQAKRTKLSEFEPTTSRATCTNPITHASRKLEAQSCPSNNTQNSTTHHIQLSEGNSKLHSSSAATVQLSEGTSKLHTTPPATTSAIVSIQDVMDSLQRTHLLYDRAGEEHYNIISALHKSMRGSDADASLYWLARMLCAGEDPLYVARRVVRFASEDIGLADPNALNQAVAAFQACHQIGKPECEVILAQAVVYMARAPKSVEVYMAYERAKQCILNHKGPLPSVPLHLRNAPTKLMKSLGYGKGYKYNPGFREPVEQQYMPNGLEGISFFTNQ